MESNTLLNMNQKKKPLIFLFTCVKNGTKYIGKLFDSLLQQTSDNFIHYIYDDGSDDNLEELVNNYKEQAAKLGKKFQIIFERNPINIGLNMSTKHCIDVCFLEYFVWVDCDNWVDKDFILNVEKAINKNPNSSFFRTNTKRIVGGKIRNALKDRRFKLSLNQKYALYYFYFTNFYYCSFFVVNTEKYKQINLNNFLDIRHYFNDVQVLTTLYMSDERGVFIKNAYGYCLLHNQSESHIEKYDFNKIEYAKKLLINGSFSKQFEHINTLKEVDDKTEEFIKLNKERKLKEARRAFKERNRLCKKYNIPYRVANKSCGQLAWYIILYLVFPYSIYLRLK